MSAVAPSLAARLAERWFLTPPRHRRPARELDLIAAACARPVRVGPDAHVETWRWGQGPAVLLVHGWGGRGSQLGALVPPLLAQGFSAVTFDAPGHGFSPQRRVTIPAMVAALRAVAGEHGPIAGLIAHSVGAVVAARALYEGLAASGGAVFVAPPADLAGPAASFTGALGFSRAVRDEMQRRIERRAGMPWSAFSMATLAPALAVPLLTIHDRDDAEVPWQHGRAVAALWPGAELAITEGLGHRRILRDPEVVARAVAFVAARAAERGWAGARPRRAAPETLRPVPAEA
jgi:pimeloyl-ACP methyl ester carboxylesterase